MLTEGGNRGLASFLEVKDKPFTITPTEFSEYSFPLSNTYIESKQKELPVSFEEEIKPNSKYVQSSKDGKVSSSTPFDKLLDEVSSSNPSVKNLRKFLTETARAESNFDFNIQNKAGAPAYGAFQFMDFNIKPLGVNIEQFRNNPKLQIEAAASLANQFKSQFTEEDKRLAKEKGYNENALLAGAWLGGVGGVRKVLRGQGNPSDKHWSKEGKGTTVKDRMDKFNKMQKGGVLKYEKSLEVDAISGAAIRADKQDKPLGWFAQWANKRARRSINPELGIPDKTSDGIWQLIRGSGQPVRDSVADAAWAKRLGQPYNKKFLPSNGVGSVRLPLENEKHINVDTNRAKEYITKLNNKVKENNQYLQELGTVQTPEALNQYEWIKDNTNAIDSLKTLHTQNLDSLRAMYRDKREVKTSEYVSTNPDLYTTRDTNDFRPYNFVNDNPTPLNTLKNFTVGINKDNNKYYRDTYNFDKKFQPYTFTLRPPYKIQGIIPE